MNPLRLIKRIILWWNEKITYNNIYRYLFLLILLISYHCQSLLVLSTYQTYKSSVQAGSSIFFIYIYIRIKKRKKEREKRKKGREKKQNTRLRFNYVPEKLDGAVIHQCNFLIWGSVCVNTRNTHTYTDRRIISLREYMWAFTHTYTHIHPRTHTHTYTYKQVDIYLGTKSLFTNIIDIANDSCMTRDIIMFACLW